MADEDDGSLEAADDTVMEDARAVAREPSDYEKRLRRDLARTRDQVRAVQNERDVRLAALLKEKDDTISSIRTDATARVIAAELKAHALKAGIVDVDALRLADMSTLAMSEDGILNGAEALLDKLRVDKPYLFGDMRLGVANGTTGHIGRPPAPAAPAPMDARTLSREAWHAERERLLGRGDQGRDNH